ncbi:hypothetical protein ABT009_39590 [Streptomyces sp. NPDC002896]|uniref:hypothetical protein n=1 Tax=Streptomyces sp. NPDC002896 TaxID=3154438 RepID=UPI003317C536
MSVRSWFRLLTVIAARMGLSMAAGLLIWAHAPALLIGWHGRPRRLHAPASEARDVVVYQPLQGRTPRSGQVVVVIDPARPPRLLIHRVGKVWGYLPGP